MAGVCPVCRFERVNDVNADLIQGTLTFKQLEQQYGLSDSSLQRHKTTCLVKAVAESREKRNSFTSASLLDTLERIQDECWRIHEMNVADRPDTAIKAIQQIGAVVDRATAILKIASEREAASGNLTSADILRRGRIMAAERAKREQEMQAEIEKLRAIVSGRSLPLPAPAEPLEAEIVSE